MPVLTTRIQKENRNTSEQVLDLTDFHVKSGPRKIYWCKTSYATKGFPSLQPEVASLSTRPTTPSKTTKMISEYTTRLQDQKKPMRSLRSSDNLLSKSVDNGMQLEQLFHRYVVAPMVLGTLKSVRCSLSYSPPATFPIFPQ